MSRLASIVVVALIVGGGAARADTAAARAHYERGTTMYDLGRFADAAREYEKAYEEKNDPALLFNIAQAYRLAGMRSEALLAYRSYLRRVPNTPNRAEVEEHIRVLQSGAPLPPPPRAGEPAMGSSAASSVGAETSAGKPETSAGKPAASEPAALASATRPHEPPPPSEPPPTASEPPVTTPPPATTTAPAPTSSPATALTARETGHAAESRPLYKKWWLWAAVGGVVVAGVVIGVAVAATTPHDAKAPAGAHPVSFPTVGTSF